MYVGCLFCVCLVCVKYGGFVCGVFFVCCGVFV